MRDILLIIITILIVGCGGSNNKSIKEHNTSSKSENNNTINNRDKNDTNKTIINNLIRDKYFYMQWYLEKNDTFYKDNDIENNASIHFGNKIKYTGKGVTIAIIDDGLDVTHPDLNGSIVATYNVSTEGTDVSPTSQSDFHGTAVTGIIAANDNKIGIKGIASNAKIIFLKYSQEMSDEDTIKLFIKAKELGADIINCSWGTYDVSDSVKDVIKDLATNGRDGKGIVIVFAVGNDDKDIGNDESAIPEVIAVGSTDKDNLRAWYSNYGKNIDILAPGGYDVGIATLDPTGVNGVATLDDNYILANDENSFIGTSASAPIVTGVIALMLEKNPNLTRVEIENMLHNRSDKIGNIEYINGFNKYYGYGKINVKKLLK